MHQALHINGDFWLVVRIDLILLVLESVSKFHKISSRLVSIKESQNNLLSTFSGVIWGHNKVDFTRTMAGNVKITDIMTSNDPHNVGNFLITVRSLGKIDLKLTLTLSITWFAGCNEPVISCHSTISILDNRFWTWTKSFFKFLYFE